MKRLLFSLVVAGSLMSAHAQGLPPESFGGALWGAMIGGMLGGDCCHGFSGTGAAIGAGFGFIAGTIAGEARRQENESYSALSPSRGNSGTTGPTSPQQATQQPVANQKTASVVTHQIPDAPRVPDAPTF